MGGGGWRTDHTNVSLTEEPGGSEDSSPGDGGGAARERRALPAPRRALYRHDLEAHARRGVHLLLPACRSPLGYEPEELVGHDAYEFFHPDDLEAIQETHSTILERHDTYAVCYRIRRKDGSYTWFETTSRTVWDPETDEVLEIVAVSRDVTECKQAE